MIHGRIWELAMPLDSNVLAQLKKLLGAADEWGARGERLIEDAARLWARVRRFLAMGLISPQADLEALELACYALQLPMRSARTPAAGRLGQVGLRDRAEQAAELLISQFSQHAPEALLDRTARILHELPHRSPMLDESRLLADAVGLDDFGVTGMILHATQLARRNAGMSQLAHGFEKRELYGYWEARLKDGFHFEPIRQMAQARIENARKVSELLLAEMKDDGFP